MPPKRKEETVEDKTEAPLAKKTSKEKMPTVSPDQAATGETTPSSENEEADYKEEYNNAVFKLLKNIRMQDPELGRDIVMESLLEHYATEIRSKRSEEPEFLHEATEEFETYLALLNKVRAHGGHNMELITVQYILKHKGEGYYRNLCMSCSYKDK